MLDLDGRLNKNMFVRQVRRRRIERLLQCGGSTRSRWKRGQSGIDSRQPSNINDSQSNIQRAFRQNVLVGWSAGRYGRGQGRRGHHLHALDSRNYNSDFGDYATWRGSFCRIWR